MFLLLTLPALIAQLCYYWLKPKWFFTASGNSVASIIQSSWVKSARTVIPLSSQGNRSQPLFLFIYLYVRFGPSKWSGQNRCSYHLQSCNFLFMCLSGVGPRHNRRLQSTVETTQGSAHFSSRSHPVGMNKCCLWTCAWLRMSDHGGLALL